MNTTPCTILYVDDEPQALKYFRLSVGKEYEVLTAESVDAGWQLVEQHADRLAILVTDQRMPGALGVELLERIHESYPRVVRILTTAYSDLDDAIRAVNSGAIYAYVTKPWDLDQLRQTLRRACELHELHRERDLLMAEKLSVFQRMQLIDRLRAYAVFAGAQSNTWRRPFTALADLWSVVVTLNQSYEQTGRDIWTMTQDEAVAQARAAAIAGERLSAVAAASAEECSLAQCLSSEVEPDAISGDMRIVAAPEQLQAAFAQLIRHIMRGAAPEARAAIAIQEGAEGGAAVTISVAVTEIATGTLGFVFGADEFEAAQAQMDLLVAYLLITEQGGAITWQADGEGSLRCRVDLPSRPDETTADSGAEWIAEAIADFE